MTDTLTVQVAAAKLDWKLAADGETYEAITPIGRYAYWPGHFISATKRGTQKSDNPAEAAQADFEETVRSLLRITGSEETPLTSGINAGIVLGLRMAAGNLRRYKREQHDGLTTSTRCENTAMEPYARALEDAAQHLMEKATHASQPGSQVGKPVQISDAELQARLGNLSRFEVIDPFGRAVVHYGPLEVSLQDDFRTMKVFVEKKVTLVRD